MKRLKDFMDGLPNIPDDDVIGGGKENNKVIKKHLKKNQNLISSLKDHTTLANRS